MINYNLHLDIFTSYVESVEDEHAIEGNAEKVDEVINKLQVGTNNVGESSAHSQGIVARAVGLVITLYQRLLTVSIGYR